MEGPYGPLPEWHPYVLTSPDRAWVGGLGGMIDARMPFWREIMDGEERSVVRSGGHPRGEL